MAAGAALDEAFSSGIKSAQGNRTESIGRSDLHLTLKVKQEEVWLWGQEEKLATGNNMRELLQHACAELRVDWLDLVLLHAPDLQTRYMRRLVSFTSGCRHSDDLWWNAWNQLEKLYEWIH